MGHEHASRHAGIPRRPLRSTVVLRRGAEREHGEGEEGVFGEDADAVQEAARGWQGGGVRKIAE